MLSTGEYIVYTDEYIAVLLNHSVVVDTPCIHGEIQENSVPLEHVIDVFWDDIDSVAQQLLFHMC